jgi:hypothetical protein
LALVELKETNEFSVNSLACHISRPSPTSSLYLPLYYTQSLPGLAPSVNFHTTLPRRKEEVAAVEEKKSSFDSLYALPLGIAVAIPAIHYEWYLVNEETQVCEDCVLGVCGVAADYSI